MITNTTTVFKHDFLADFECFQRTWLNTSGYDTVGCVKRDINLRFFHVLKRKICQRQRKTEIASSFVCPVEYEQAFNVLIEKSEKGEDLSPHLSRTILDAEYKDYLLFDWGISHFHLNTDVKADGFVERSGPLLFAYVTNDTLYCIAIKEHGAWTDSGLVAVIHHEWPILIRHNKLPDGMKLTHELPDEQRHIIRKHGITTGTVLKDGSIYMAIGGGYSSSGHSTQAVMWGDYWNNTLILISEWVDTEASKIKALLEDHGIAIIEPSQLSMSFDYWPEQLLIIEDSSKAALILHHEKERFVPKSIYIPKSE